MIAVIKDWRLARAARNQPVLVPPADLRRLPGAARQPQPQAQPAAPRVDQAKLAEEAADAEVEAVFKEKLCGECHAIKSPKESVSKRWEVQPVRLQTVWLPKSRFHHGEHEAMSCNDCHGAALTSRTSADVLMPKIEVCFRCHQESATTVAVPSPCTMCHDYHDRDRHRQGDRLPLEAMKATP